jgi:putative DNA primase/helicase
VEHLSQKGAKVKVVYLPPKPSGDKQGADDFLASGHSLYELTSLATEPEKAKVDLGEYVIVTETGKAKLDLVKLTEDLLNEYRFATLRETDEVLVYAHNRWRQGGEEFIKQQCQRRVGVKEVLTQYKVAEITGHIKRTTYVTRQMFNKEKWVVNVQNGLLDLRTRELRPHTPDFLSTVHIPVTYDTQADCPRIRQFFREVLPPDDIPTIEELFGYCLIPDYSFQKAFLFVGDGANGKSTLLKLLRAFIGKDNCANVPWHALELDRFAKSELEGKLVNYFADIPSRSLNQTGTFKILTGGDPVGTEKKFKGYFSFENFARLIFSANRPPKVYGEDSFAFWRRWTIIHFPSEFTGARDDKRLLSKLTAPQELSGLLNLAIAGLERLQAQQHFSNERPVDEVTEMYLRTSDPVYAFLQDCCDPEPDYWIEKDKLYQVYVKYSEDNNLPVKKPNSFARALQNQTHIKVRSIRPRVGDIRTTAWEGIKLKDEAV